MTHKDLIPIAREWLRKTRKCSIVVSEISTSAPENPDALGWYGLQTHLVEVKASRSDFLRDRHKLSRRIPSTGMGQFRWYLTAPNVIHEISELPDGWGWVCYENSKCRTVVKATFQPEVSHRYETAVLVSLLKRLGRNAPQGTSIRCYTYETKCSTVLELEV